MNEQVAFCEAIVADLARLFPDYPSNWFTSNAVRVKLGGLLTISMPDSVARKLIDAFVTVDTHKLNHPDADAEDADDDEQFAEEDDERGIEYVEPTWRRLSSDPEDADLSKCALCGRFFVAPVPIRLFQDLGDRIVLGLELCDECAPAVLSRRSQMKGNP